MSTTDPLRRLGHRQPFARERLVADAVDVAQRLLGALLVRQEDDGETIVRIVETEAYRETDPASHSYRGRTDRTAVMFGPAGHAYVYFTYGMHHCLNVSCEHDGIGAAVLFRAAVPLAGRDRIRRRRGPSPREIELLAGPGRLTQGLGVDRDWNGLDLCAPSGRLRLETDGLDVTERIRSGPRIGVREAADRPWRFWVDGVIEVSRYTRHPRAPRSGG